MAHIQQIYDAVEQDDANLRISWNICGPHASQEGNSWAHQSQETQALLLSCLRKIRQTMSRPNCWEQEGPIKGAGSTGDYPDGVWLAIHYEFCEDGRLLLDIHAEVDLDEEDEDPIA